MKGKVWGIDLTCPKTPLQRHRHVPKIGQRQVEITGPAHHKDWERHSPRGLNLVGSGEAAKPLGRGTGEKPRSVPYPTKDQKRDHSSSPYTPRPLAPHITSTVAPWKTQPPKLQVLVVAPSLLQKAPSQSELPPSLWPPSQQRTPPRHRLPRQVPASRTLSQPHLQPGSHLCLPQPMCSHLST